MATRHSSRRRRKAGPLIIGGVAGIGAFGVALNTGGVADAAGPRAVFALGVLTIVGDQQPDTITVSRDAAGTILVNGGAVPIAGGQPTVANTRSITMLGNAGNDTLTLVEANGALPKATMIAGSGDDTVTGGSGGDLLIGQDGHDTLLAKGGSDRMFGGPGNDALTGGDADDQAFGESGDDRMIWNPGDDTDLNEGGAGTDTTEVVGGNGAERFTVTANGTRVRFDRVDPAPFAIDMGSTERLQLNANGGDDDFSATGNLAALVQIAVDGGAGNDDLLGSNGVDVMIGGDGIDFLDGQQGNDVAFLGAGDDTFQWDPGDGSDVVEGQDGADSMLFNGSNGAEIFDTSANGGRVRFFRNLGNITMDLDDVEAIRLNALGGADHLVVNDVTGTDLTAMDTDLASPAGSGTHDGQVDTVTVHATNGNDIVTAAGLAGDMRVEGLAAVVSVSGASPDLDALTINGLAGDDVVDGSGVAADSMVLTVDAGVGDDVAIGGAGDDTLRGGDGDDVLVGGDGIDTLDGGAGSNTLVDGEIIVNGVVQTRQWLAERTREEGGQTVLDTGDKAYAIPEADLAAP